MTVSTDSNLFDFTTSGVVHYADSGRTAGSCYFNDLNCTLCIYPVRMVSPLT